MPSCRAKSRPSYTIVYSLIRPSRNRKIPTPLIRRNLPVDSKPWGDGPDIVPSMVQVVTAREWSSLRKIPLSSTGACRSGNDRNVSDRSAFTASLPRRGSIVKGCDQTTLSVMYSVTASTSWSFRAWANPSMSKYICTFVRRLVVAFIERHLPGAPRFRRVSTT